MEAAESMGDQDPKANGSPWAAEWIEQQRELLRQRTAAGGAGGTEEVRAIGDKWLDLGQSWLQGIADTASQGTQSFAGFQVGEELLDAWKSAWTAAGVTQQSAARAFSDMLGRLPPVGLAREHTEAWRELAAAQAECAQLEQELRGALLGVQRDALDLLEQRVRERKEPIGGYRDLYNLWVECAEQVFAKVAHSETYGKLQAELGNASMRLRARQQKVVEYGLRQFDLPTRSELNSVHRQIRALKQQVADLSQGRSKPKAKKAVRAAPKRRAAKGRSR
ncbi:poly(R)-hydroxyalkanoic acid synthase subunit PhaE [Povalibacter uvarum]|nr:poly(R)-hydroxyalkanoic acid synthase subunit PhaE [Povalibacter uvarum]